MDKAFALCEWMNEKKIQLIIWIIDWLILIDREYYECASAWMKVSQALQLRSLAACIIILKQNTTKIEKEKEKRNRSLREKNYLIQEEISNTKGVAWFVFSWKKLKFCNAKNHNTCLLFKNQYSISQTQ